MPSWPSHASDRHQARLLAIRLRSTVPMVGSNAKFKSVALLAAVAQRSQRQARRPIALWTIAALIISNSLGVLFLLMHLLIRRSDINRHQPHRMTMALILATCSVRKMSSR